MTSAWRGGFPLVFGKDTSGMFLLHRCLGRVDGFTDAAQLRGEHMRGVNLGRLLRPLTDMTTANSQVWKR